MLVHSQMGEFRDKERLGRLYRGLLLLLRCIGQLGGVGIGTGNQRAVLRLRVCPGG